MTARVFALLLSALAPACTHATAPCARLLGPGPRDFDCGLSGFDGRDYRVHVPFGYAPDRPLPVVLALHGGGGDRDAMQRLSCPEGRTSDPRCFDGTADRERFAVVYPNGTPGAWVRQLRTWNAGGGLGELRCVSGRACEDGVDDVAYFAALLDDLERVLPVDRARVYAIGFSNGAAMSHRLACVMSERVAAIVALGGANQVAFAQGCAPGRPVAVLQVHGTEDPCWSYEGRGKSCLGSAAGRLVGVSSSMESWAQLLGCRGAPTIEPLPDLDPADGTRASRERWSGCRAPLELIRIDGAGHTWPGGFQYFREGLIGRPSHDVDINAMIWSFLSGTHRAP